MKGKYILFLFCSLFLCEVSAQTLEQARTLFTKGDYEKPSLYSKSMQNPNLPMEIIIIGTAYVA